MTRTVGYSSAEPPPPEGRRVGGGTKPILKEAVLSVVLPGLLSTFSVSLTLSQSARGTRGGEREGQRGSVRACVRVRLVVCMAASPATGTGDVL